MRVYYDIQDLAEQIEIFELFRPGNDQPAVHSLDDILAEDCLNRDDLDDPGPFVTYGKEVPHGRIGKGPSS